MRPDLRAYLLGDDGHRVFGPGPVDLLERVGELGSLRAAAIEMGMAYTKATRLVRDAERAFGFALTERTVGGSGGGGSQLTAEARELIERYRAFERTSRWALSASYETCFSGFVDVPRLGCVVMASGEGARFGGAPRRFVGSDGNGFADVSRLQRACETHSGGNKRPRLVLHAQRQPRRRGSDTLARGKAS